VKYREILRVADRDVGDTAGLETCATVGQHALTSAATRQGKSAGDWRNPFIVGVPITDPADFFGREREISFCLARLRGMQSVSITGERRIGKSSLLHYLTATALDRLGPDYRPAYVDLLSAVAHTLPGLLGEILHQLRVTRPAATLVEFEQRLNELHDQALRPLVALDELEMFVRLPNEFSHDFCEALRALASNHRLALLTASRATLREMHDQGALVSPLYNIMGARKLGLFSEDEARDFVAARRPGGRFTPAQVAEILQRSACHPQHLQVFLLPCGAGQPRTPERLARGLEGSRGRKRRPCSRQGSRDPPAHERLPPLGGVAVSISCSSGHRALAGRWRETKRVTRG